MSDLVMSLLVAEAPSRQLLFNRRYACHQAVCDATDGGSALWADLSGAGRAPVLRVLSARRLAPVRGWTLRGQRDYPISTISNDDCFRFQITLSPAVKRNGKRYAVWTIGDETRSPHSRIEEWFRPRASAGGFAPEAVEVRAFGFESCQRRSAGTRGSSKIHFGSATIAGKLKVTDADRFHQVASKGIGPQKAFGCGLLLLKRIGD